jgi:hypothetical protein
VEQDILAILSRRGANILWAPARDLPKLLAKDLKPAFDEGRLLILSPFDYHTSTRPTRQSCSTRNRCVLRFAKAQYLPHVAEGSSLAADLEHHLL